MKEFEDQVAVVTGGARGIGAEIARRLARGGATVVCADVLDTAEIVAEINGAGGTAEGRELDVTEAEAAAGTVAAIHEAHGRLDILVNNAGITRDQLLVRMKPEDWDLVLGINLDGVFNVTQPVAKLMMRAKSGRIVNVARRLGGRIDGQRRTD
jgi:3-oxoacyl-[acyl-carrier protein] reductase